MASRPSTFLTATWRDLALLSYEADPKVLARYLPPGVELDTWDGKHLISIVGLQFLDTKVLGVPLPFYRNYPQVNLRFYVRRWLGGECRAGVVFIKQIVPRKPVALVARRMYQEKFIAASVRHWVETLPGPESPEANASDNENTPPVRGDLVEGRGSTRSPRTGHLAAGLSSQQRASRLSYQWSIHDASNRMSVTISGEPEPSGIGSLEEFVVERYYGYNQLRNGSTLEFRIDHPRWRLWRAAGPELVCNVAQVYGEEFVESLSGQPVSALAAEGSEVTVYRGVAV